MKNFLIFNSERFDIIPNKFWKNLIFMLKKLKPEWINIIECDSLTIKKVISENKIDVVFFPRGYGIEFSNLFSNQNVLKISQMDDLHYHNEATREKLHKIFSNSDIILLPYYLHFLEIKEYKKYQNKACLFPFAVPENILNHSQDIKNEKILLSGRTSKSYSFRRELANYASINSHVDILEHPGYDKLSHQVVGKKYYNHISNYVANIVTSADKPIDYPVAKYFEISGSNTVPIFEEISSLNILGFKKDIHYIEINNKNYKNILNLNTIKNFEYLKNNSNFLIKNKHLLNNRANLIYEIIKKQIPINWSL
jgi:hypothetical protein